MNDDSRVLYGRVTPAAGAPVGPDRAMDAVLARLRELEAANARLQAEAGEMREIVDALAANNPRLGCSSCEWRACRFCKRERGHTDTCLWAVATKLAAKLRSER